MGPQPGLSELPLGPMMHYPLANMWLTMFVTDPPGLVHAPAYNLSLGSDLFSVPGPKDPNSSMEQALASTALKLGLRVPAIPVALHGSLQ